MVESWIVDFRYALRRLMRRPTYAILAVLTLALGVGGTAAIFSVARTLLFEPLPIAQEEQVGVFYFPYSWNESEFLYLRGRFPGFRTVAAYRGDNATLESEGAPLRLVEGMAVTAEFFDVLGAPAMLGRTFKTDDDATGAEPASVLSHSLWLELGADPAITRRIRVGEPIMISLISGGAPIASTVNGVDPQVDTTTRLASVYARVPASAGVGPGEPLRGNVTVSSGANALVIPYAALLDDGGRSYVFVIKQGVASKRSVSLGNSAGDHVQVLKGLAPGEQVVTEGGTALEDGMRVRMGAAAPAAGEGKQ